MLIHEESGFLGRTPSSAEQLHQDGKQPEGKLARSPDNSSPCEQDEQSLLDRVAIGIFRMTVAGRYLWVNETFAKIYGYDSAAAFLQIFSERKEQIYVTKQQYRHLQNLIHTRGIVEGFETKIYRCDRKIIWISETGKIIRDEQENTIYYEGFVIDITQQKQIEIVRQELEQKYKEQSEKLQQVNMKLATAESQLKQRERLSSLGELIVGIAHEIKNPVGFTCGNIVPARQYADDLLHLLTLYQDHYPKPGDAIAEFIEEIDLDFLKEDFPKVLSSMELGTERIRKIVQSLSNFSHLDDNCMNLVNLHEGLDSTLIILKSRLQAQANKPTIEIEKNYGNLPDRILCYGGLLNQVFMNLLSNAIDALEEKYTDSFLQSDRENISPKIWLQTRKEGKWINISIRDNAGGIPPEIQEKIFTSFFTTKPLGKGTGLGLSISYEIVVRKHRGRLECLSSLGKGTEFAIAIPLQVPNQENTNEMLTL